MKYTYIAEAIDHLSDAGRLTQEHLSYSLLQATISIANELADIGVTLKMISEKFNSLSSNSDLETSAKI